MKSDGLLRRSCSLIWQAWNKFNADNGEMATAAVSFYVFLSLIPLLLIAVAVFGLVLQSREHAYNTVADAVRTYSPALAERGSGGAAPMLRDIVRGSRAATGLGIAGLLWSGSQAFIQLERAVNIAWGCKPRGFFTGRLIAGIMLALVGTLLLVSFGVTAIADHIRSAHYVVFGHNVSGLFGIPSDVLSYVLPFIVTILTFTMIYKVLPDTAVPMRAALVGGLFAGGLWELAKYGFSLYVTSFAHVGAIYGSLAGIILLLLWIYYSSLVTILGAEVSAIFNARRTIQQ